MHLPAPKSLDPPRSIESEAALLGALIVDGSQIEPVLKIMTGAQDFYLAKHVAIYSAIVELHETQKPTGVLEVKNWLADHKQLDEIGGLEYLVEVGESVPDASLAEFYAKSVREYADRRRIIDHALKIAVDASDPEIRPASLIERCTEVANQFNYSPLATQTPSLICLADVNPKPLKWLWWQKIARGKLTILAGEPGLGKSTITLDIAARVSAGLGWPDCTDIIDAEDVILLSAEDDAADTTLPRLLAAGADVRRIHIMSAVFTDPNNPKSISSFTLTKNLPALEEAITKLRPALIVIDPVTAYLGSTDSHKNADVRAVLAPLAELAAKYNVAIVIVSHLNKSSGSSAMNRVTGSGAFVAAARAAWVVAKDPEDHTGARRLFLPAKNNLGKDSSGLAYTLEDRGSVAVVRWDQVPVTMSADSALSEPKETPGPEPEKREAAETWLKKALADGPRPSSELFDEAKNGEGISRTTLERSKTQLGVKAFRPTNPGPWFWKLPEHTAK